MKKCEICENKARGKRFCSKKCYGIHKHNTHCNLNKDDIYQLYVVQKKSMSETASILDCAFVTLAKYMKRYGIEQRLGYEDYTNKRMGKLLFLERISPNKTKGAKDFKWKAICDCGNEYIILAHSIKTMKLQACLSCVRENKRKFKYIYSHNYQSAKTSAKARNHEFAITGEYMDDLFEKQNKKCPYSGVELTFTKWGSDDSGTASLDRIDSSKGYIEGNVQWIHKRINIMKNNMDEKELFYWCNLISKNHPIKIDEDIKQSPLMPYRYEK